MLTVRTGPLYTETMLQKMLFQQSCYMLRPSNEAENDFKYFYFCNPTPRKGFSESEGSILSFLSLYPDVRV